MRAIVCETVGPELQKRSNGRTIYVLDEPTTGLHFEDIRKLLLVLQGLVDKGNTVLVIEHNLDVVKSADWIIDMGPEGGDGGGRVVASGTPEEVAEVEESYTGQFLGPILAKSGTSPIVGELVEEEPEEPRSMGTKKAARKKSAPKRSSAKKAAAVTTKNAAATKKATVSGAASAAARRAKKAG